MASKKDALNKQQYDKLWKAARSGDDLDRVLFVLTAQLGLRKGEAAQVRDSWLDFQRKYIQIPEKDGDWTPKTPHAARRVYWKHLNKAEKIIPDYFEFNSNIPIKAKSINYRVNKWARKADLKVNVYPHALRATAALKFASAGFSAQALRSIMGWADLETANKYISASSRAVEQDLERYGDQIA